ncbi:hypothetical protein OTU49_006257, partial [Cherax quadricarinatus]
MLWVVSNREGKEMGGFTSQVVVVLVTLLTCQGHCLTLHGSLARQAVVASTFYLRVTTCSLLLKESHCDTTLGDQLQFRAVVEDAVSAENPHNPHHHHSNHQPLPPPSSPLPSSSSAAPPQQQRLRLQLFHDDENIGGEHVREETAQSPGREKFSLHQRSIRSLEG